MVYCWTDGACDNKVGVMGAGALVVVDRKRVFESSFYVPYLGTSNIAEWLALIEVLNYLSSGDYENQHITIYSDSMLIVSQFRGSWAIKLPHLRELNAQAQQAAKGLLVTLIWIPREQNWEADKLSKLGLQKFYTEH